MNRHLTLSKALTAVLLFMGIAFGQSAFAQNTTWSIGASTSNDYTTFTVTRSGSISQAVTVKYRFVNLSAYAGQHYKVTEVDGVSFPVNEEHLSGELTFGAGDNQATVIVKEITPETDAFKFQNGTSRSYRLEVTDLGGFELKHYDQAMTTGTSVPSSDAFSIKDVVIENNEYTVDDRGYATNPVKYVESSSYFSNAAPMAYYKHVDAQLRMTLSFKAKENDDAFEYVQILFDNIETCDNRSGAGDGNPGTPSLSSYMAGFEMDTKNKDANYKSYNFPITSVGSNLGASDPWGYGTAYPLHNQKFKSTYRADDGRLIVPRDFSTLVLRLNASGTSGSDQWAVKEVKAHIQAVEEHAPTMQAISAAPGLHAKGNTVYVSVAFTEIVQVSGTPTLTTTPGNNWGSLSYVAGSGSNVLTFSKIIPDNASGNLNITGLSCTGNSTVKDLAGNSVSGSSVTASNLCSLDASYAYPISYDLAGGSVAIANPACYTWETATFTLVNPTRTGYTFAGWTGSNGNTPQTNVSITNHSHGDKSYTANWDPHTYSIRFNANAGTGTAATGTMTNQSFTYDEAQNLTANTFSRMGYTFAGWSTSENGAVDYTDGQSVSNLTPENGAIIDLYAQWDVHHYTIQFDKNSNEATGTMANQAFTYDQGVLNANTFARIGYTFTGWNTQADGNGTSYPDQQASPNVTATNNATVTLYAQWTPISYTVHFNANYDNNGIVISGSMSDQTLTYDQGTLNANAFTRTGYTFVNWNTEADGSGATYTDQQAAPNVTATNGATVTLYPQWSVTPWEGSGTSENDPYLIIYASQLVKLADSVNSGTKDYSGKYLKLGNDIDMDGIAFDGIGNYTNSFQGTFDGAGKTLSHVTVNRSTENCVGVFGEVYDGTVKNLILDGASVTGYIRVGVLVGNTLSINDTTTIENCLVLNSSISGHENKYVGVISGNHGGSDVTYCANHYRGCTFLGTANATNVGVGDSNTGTNHGAHDIAGARSIHTLTIPERVTATSTDTVTYNHVLYYASNVSVTLTPEMYYTISNVTVNGEAATNNGDGTWSFFMPAEDATVSATVKFDLPGTGEENDPYIISDTTQFNLVATLVNNGESFNGVYFKLADNANITVSNMIGTSAHPFSGNFDGNRSHNATLTLDLLFDTEVICTAPFRYVSGANIHDLFVGGNMRIGNNSQYAASIVAYSEGTTILNNCVSNVEINSEAHNSFAYNGGLVGHVASGSTLNITNCVFKGRVFYHNSGQCCGFVGLNEGTTNINGGIYEPSYQQLYYNYYYYNFINPDMGTYSLIDCYYTQPMGESWQGTIAYTSVRDNLCHQISIAGETVYASPDDTFIDNVNGVYDYTGAVININPTVIFGGETLDPSCYTLSLTYNGNPATEVNARGNYLYTAAGVNANGYYGNVYRYFSVVGFDGSGTDSDPYLIESIEDWNKLASRVEAGTTFSGKHFKLMANLTISKVVGYTKIQSFQGIFDGNGHTLTLNGDNFGTSGYYTSFHVCAPFRYVAGTTIKNLKIAGDIYTKTKFAGGLIGRAGDGDNVIQNCIVSVNIHSSVSGDGTHGGFIAHLQGGNGALSETTFTGCAFTGSITTTNNTTNVGGFVGWCDWGNGPDNGHCRLFFNDCFINPSASCISSGSKTFARCSDESQSLSGNINNGYFTQAIGDVQGKRVENDSALPIGSYTSYNVSGLKFYDNGVKDSDGTFFHNNNALSNVITREITGYGEGSGHWAFIASPIEGSIAPNTVTNLIGASIPETNPVAYDFDLYRLDPSDLMWENYHTHTADFNLVNGQGYLYATKETKTLTFTGTLDTGGEKAIAGLPNGYNLVGNPFCIEAYVNKPYYTLDDNGAIIVANPVDKATPIQPCYGVIVKVENNEDIVFRTTEPFTNSNNGSLEMTLAQTVANRDGYALKTLDNAIISFDEGSKLTKFYFGHQDANIYIPVGHEEYAIAYSEGQGEMPLNFKATKNGTYTLSVNTEGLELGYLHLIDNLTSANIDLLQTPSYTFTAKTTDYASRFKLVFSDDNNDFNPEGNNDFAFIDGNGEIHLLVETCHGASLQIIDALGRIIVTNVGLSQCGSPTAGMASGVYVLRLIDGENVRIQKIVIK
ncbi:MAG: InlB B-repeat-containing protein [Bacteroidales bacterium]|nr:InlB B-repeat-containing protein [Bacteroidales bacterium]